MQQPLHDETEEKETEEETEEQDEEFIDEDFGGEAERKVGTTCPITRTVTLQMLLAANILQPGEGAMSIEYLGQRFVGDLLPDGKIRSQETDVVFASPSAWAVHCKRIINPVKRSGCGWASIRYRGRKLDAYKNTWFNRKTQENKEIAEAEEEESAAEKDKMMPAPPAPASASNASSVSAATPSTSTCPPPTNTASPATQTPPAPPPVRIPVKHNFLGSRNSLMHDANTLVECTSFSTLSKIQPFLVSVASSALLVIDLHSHLSSKEVVGYLAGQWDVNAHNLSVTNAFPCRCRLTDREAALAQEQEISREMEKLNLVLVGWYHSHPTFAAAPSLKDIDAQLDHQMKMKGVSDSSYTPCVGLICSPYLPDPSTESTSTIISYWVIPPPENKPHDFGKPMLMTYNMVQDAHLSPEAFNEIKRTIAFYKEDPDLIKFQDKFKGMTYLEKLKGSLSNKFPRDQTDGVLWGFIEESLCPSGEPKEYVPKVMSTPSSATGLNVPTVPINLPVGGKTSTSSATSNGTNNAAANFFLGTEMANAILAAGKLPSSTSIMSNLFLSPMSLNLLGGGSGKNSGNLSALGNFNFSNLATLSNLANINLSAKNMGAGSKKGSCVNVSFGGYGNAGLSSEPPSSTLANAASNLTFGADGVKNITSSLLNSLGTTITATTSASAAHAVSGHSDNGISNNSGCATDMTTRQGSGSEHVADMDGAPSAKVPKLDISYTDQPEASVGKS